MTPLSGKMYVIMRIAAFGAIFGAGIDMPGCDHDCGNAFARMESDCALGFGFGTLNL